jgi:Flp pilus assembly protein TadG
MRGISPRTQRGGETVEFALFTLPVLVLIFVTFVEFGFGFADKAVIVDASRAAAREAIKGATNTEICAAADQVLASAGTWGTDAPYSCQGSCGSACQIDRSAGTDPGDPIDVTLTFPFQFRILPPLSEIRILSFIPNLGDIQLTGETVMYIP